MRTANPALNRNTFAVRDTAGSGAGAMTIQGTVNKTGLLLVLTIAAAAYTWNTPRMALTLMPVGAIGGLIVAMITVFRKRSAPVTAPMYAVLEGLFLGGISVYFERAYPGIVSNAVFLTFGILFALLFAYRTGLIKATENFKLGVAAATGGIFLVYMASFILGFFGVRMPFLHSSGPLGIGISLVIVVVAALNLVLDFDFIEQGAEQGAPKFMEWYAAFGLLVTLIWLYLEILRLLAKLQNRR
ncbi:MAG: hypothetical protein GF418_03120 [Chitinivibrionales bacterium]|nr:hypothetical protein [Chitinivibrionales bacterium]MBD3394594.1 hypothetical protein [Chitinivibrionales bacterium]